MILSTCRYGILARITGINWRYMNVPEHLYYYSLDALIRECEKIGFKKISLFEKWEELIRDTDSLSIFPDDEKKSEQKAWEKYFSTLNAREKILRESNDPELQPFLTLINRFYTFTKITDWRNCLKEKVVEQVKNLNIKKDEKII